MMFSRKVFRAAMVVSAILVFCVTSGGARSIPPAASTKIAGRVLADLTAGATDPSQSLTLELETPWPGNIAFTTKKPAAVSLVLGNVLDQPVHYDLHVTVEDWYGNKHDIAVHSIFIGPRNWFRQEVAIDASRPNYYRIDADVSLDGKSVERVWKGVAVVETPPNFGKDDPASFFGLQGSTDGARTERLGVKWVRTNATANPYTLDQIRSHHQMIMATVWPFHWGGSVSTSLQGALPDMAALESTIRTDAPEVYAFEIMNEPDLNCGPQVHLDFQGSVDYYLNVMRQVGPAVRQAAPAARVSGIDVSGVDYDNGLKFANYIMAHGGSDLVDICSCHPYVYPRDFGEGQDPVWPTAGQEARKCQDTLAMIRQYGGKQAFWVGEKGWGLDITADPLSVYSRDFASCLTQSMVTEKSVPGVEKYFWYCEEDGDEGGYGYGLFRNGQPLPAALAYSTMARLLHHAKPFLSPKRNDTVQVHCFVSQESHLGTLVIWNDSKTPVSFTIAKMPVSWTAVDMMGNPLAPSGRGGLHMLLDRSPVYIQFPADAAEQACTAIARATTTYDFPLNIETAYVADLSHVAVRVYNIGESAVVGRFKVGSATKNVTVAGGQRITVTLPAPAHLATTGLQDIPVQITIGKQTHTLDARADLAPCKRTQGIPTGGLLTAWDALPDFVLDQRAQVMPPDSGIDWNGPDDLSARAWTGWDDAALYLSIRVHDNIHSVQGAALDNFWNSDSVQIAIDPHNDAAPGSGFDSSDVELGLVLAPDGPRVYETAPVGQQIQIPCAIVRQEQDKVTLYQVAIPWSLLKLRPQVGQVLGFDFIVNQDSGQGRIYWMGLTPGIGERQQPWVYQKLYLAAPTK